jgi:BlaI family penicillinase repressor
MTDGAPDLGELEREAMQLVWAAGETAADAIGERLARKPKQSTARTVLRQLEDKGYITHAVDGRTYVFRAAEARPQVAARAAKAIVDWLCNGSVEEVPVGAMDARMLDGGTLQRLAKRIEQAKEEKAEEKAEGKKEGQT